MLRRKSRLWNGISAMFDPVIHRPRTNAVAVLDYSSADQPLPSSTVNLAGFSFLTGLVQALPPFRVTTFSAVVRQQFLAGRRELLQ
jgi:hypothetical protein